MSILMVILWSLYEITVPDYDKCVMKCKTDMEELERKVELSTPTTINYLSQRLHICCNWLLGLKKSLKVHNQSERTRF